MARRRARALRWRSARQRFQTWLATLPLWRMSRDDLSGYGYALFGVAGASLVIALVGKIGHVSNISLLYLLVVLWLAAWVGRGPAILASVLAFLAYDLFFISPFFRLTV